MGRRGRRRRRTAGAAARSPDILHADTALAAVTEQLEGMKVHADTALAAVTEQLEGMKVAGERRVEVLTRRQEWREELTAQQVVVSLATRMQAAARGLLTRAALRRINTLVSPVRGKMSGLYLNRVYGDRPVYFAYFKRKTNLPLLPREVLTRFPNSHIAAPAMHEQSVSALRVHSTTSSLSVHADLIADASSEAGFRTSKLAAPPSQIGGAPLAAPRGHLSGNGAGTHGDGKKKPSNAKKNATRQAAAAQARAEREKALDFAQGAGQVDGVWYLDSKELKLALDRWERRNDSDASSLPQSLAQSLEPSERGSDDCPILSEDSFTGFSDCAEW